MTRPYSVDRRERVVRAVAGGASRGRRQRNSRCASVADREAEHWTSMNWDALWQEVAELGLERNGTLIVEQRALMDFPAVGSLSRGLGSDGV
jgi:hypothetical protein